MIFPTLTVRPALRTWAICCVLFVGTVLLFSRSTGFGFTNYDDPRYVTNNGAVQAGFVHDSIVWAFTAPESNWHPLTWFSHMLDWKLFGNNAGGHHLTSVVWHALNAVLVFLVLRRLTGGFWASALAAALFAWHPLRVESVTWISERKDVLSGFFFLLTLWAYAGYATRREAKRPAWGNYLLTLGCFAGGLMSKPMVVSLPFVLLLLDFWPLRRVPALNPANKSGIFAAVWSPWFRLILEKIPFFVLSIAGSAVAYVMQQRSGAFTLTLPFDARLYNAFVAIVRYLGKFFWPFDLTVCYPHPGYWPAWAVVACVLVIAGLSAAAWQQRQQRPWLVAGWGWFFVMLLPAIGLVQVGYQAMADRYTYLPIIGLELALLWSLASLPIRGATRGLTVVLGGLLLIGCAVRTWQQQATWRDPVTLFEHAIAVTDRNDVAEGFLGYTFTSMDRWDEAADHCARALQINPRNETALFALAMVREKQQRFEEAVTTYRTILGLNPADKQSEFYLGRILLVLGRTDEAVTHLKAAASGRPDLAERNLQFAMADTMQGQTQRALTHFEIALALGPNDPEAHYAYGVALAALGRADEALARYRTATQIKSDHAGAQTEIGLVLLQRRQPEEAATCFRAALQAQPKFGLAHLGLGRALEQLGRTPEATASFAQAIACEPRNPQFYGAWAETLARRGQFAEAVPQYERALQLRPGDAGMHAGLGFALFLSNRRGEAVAHWEQALRLNPNIPGLRERLQKVRGELDPGSP